MLLNVCGRGLPKQLFSFLQRSRQPVSKDETRPRVNKDRLSHERQFYV